MAQVVVVQSPQIIMDPRSEYMLPRSTLRIKWMFCIDLPNFVNFLARNELFACSDSRLQLHDMAVWGTLWTSLPCLPCWIYYGYQIQLHQLQNCLKKSNAEIHASTAIIHPGCRSSLLINILFFKHL